MKTRPGALEDALILANITAQRFAIPRELQSRIDRDDLIAEARIAAWKAHESYDPTRGMAWKAWVVLKCRGAVIEALRTADPIPRGAREKYGIRPGDPAPYSETPLTEAMLDCHFAAPSPAIEALPDQIDARRLIADCFHHLTPRERLLFRLAALGYSHSEIAQRLGCTKNRVQQLRAAATRRLRTRFKHDERKGGEVRKPRP